MTEEHGFGCFTQRVWGAEIQIETQNEFASNSCDSEDFLCRNCRDAA